MNSGDFENEDEEAPESLRSRWEKEEFHESLDGKHFLDCPHCRMKIDAKSFSCLYCGNRVFQDSGFLGLFLKHRWLIVFLILTLAVIFLMVM
jgi:hypothetical protein